MGFIIVCTNYGLHEGNLMRVFEKRKAFSIKYVRVMQTQQNVLESLRLQIQKEDIVQQYLENKQRGEQRFKRNPRNRTFLTKNG